MNADLRAQAECVLDLENKHREALLEVQKLAVSLIVQARVKAAGFDPDTIEKYGYDPTKDKSQKPLGFVGRWPPQGRPGFYNIAILNDGTRVPIALVDSTEEACIIMGLLSTTNRPSVKQKVLSAARTQLKLRGSVQADFEHGQWWVTQLMTGKQWSVVDTLNGVEFEQVSHGEEG